MGLPAAKQGDRVVATDLHIIQPPGAPPPPPTPVPHAFSGPLTEGLSTTVRIEGRAAATTGSVATNTPPHVPSGGTFVNPPDNRGTITAGSSTVRINGKAAARSGDAARTCADPAPNPAARVVASGTVRIGG
uniref:PAAR domain-containing protein n=1 Tax=Paractinoplanes polyasparticus TaxID=2856853 RepID=UPI001C85C130|nr:PAAR domain-containing protein [Actinoplanes polyasparticus]